MNNIISEIKVSNNIVLLCHNNPDGDAIGSTIAMYNLIKKLGKEVDIVIDTLPKKFNFLNEYSIIKKESTKKYNTAVVLDTATKERVNSAYILDNVQKKLVIDHHQSNTKYGDINLIEAFPACCQVVYKLIKEMNIPLDKDLALPLAVGLLTDTGGFAHQDVLPSTFAMAEELSQIINISEVYQKVLNTITINQFNIKNKALQELEFYHNKSLAVLTVTEEDMKHYEVEEDECSLLAGLPLEIETVEVSLFLRKYQDKTRISLRSKNINVSEVLSPFGGGGHINAAGITITIPYKEIKEKLIKEVGKKINEWNTNNK